MQKLKLHTLMPSIDNDISYEYNSIKTDEYENIINNMLAVAKKSDNPYFVQVMGIPGAGKSTFCNIQKKDDSVLIAFDKVMESIPQYKIDNKNLGSIESFKKWEMPARVIGYEVLRRAVEEKKNIFFDHSGLFVSCIDLMKNLNKYSYVTEMHCLKCDIDEAVVRTQKREVETKRHTPKSMIEERIKKLDTFLDQYRVLANKLTVYDTTNHKFELKEEYFNK